MTEALLPYPAMKDSGVSWLREVPEHWEVEPIARIGQLFKGRGGSKGDEVRVGVPCVRYGDLYTRHEFFMSATKGFVTPHRASAYTSIRRGDVLFAASGETDEDIGRSAVSLLDGKAVCGGDVIVLRPNRRMEPKFLGYAADAPSSRYQKTTMGRGFTIVHIYAPELKRLVLAIPPLEEQTSIVRFLDRADRRIRRYIHAKQKLIKLLEEQKQAIIHRAVTRGLDPNVRLKPSGVEWLGDVPEHWEVVRLKTLASRITSGSRGWSNFAADSGAPFIRISNLTRASIDLDMTEVVRLRLPPYVLGEAARTRVQRDDVLLSITAFIGSVAVVPGGLEDAYVSQHVACCRLRGGKANPRWVAYVLLSTVGQTYGQLSMYGGTKQGLSLDDVKNYVVVLPPRRLQDSLVEWIECSLAGLSAGIASAKHEIALLREYRTRLIADVVTGKLDVRAAAARLPEMRDESDEIDAEEELEEAVEESRATEVTET